MPKGWFSSVGTQTGTIKLAMASTDLRVYSGLVAPISSIANSIWLECGGSLITKR